MIEFWMMDWQAKLWFTIWKRFFTPAEIDWWEAIEERLCIISVSFFWYEFFIDKIVWIERVIEQEED